MRASSILICIDHMGSDMVEKFLTNWDYQDPRFWWSLFPMPVRATNSSALGASVGQKGLTSPQDRSVLDWVATPVSIASRASGKTYCCPTSGCNKLHIYSSMGLCWEQEGKEGDFPRQISRKTESNSGKLWIQTLRVCIITAVIHILSLLLFHTALWPQLMLQCWGKKPQETSNPAPEVQQCPGLEPQASHTPVKTG